MADEFAPEGDDRGAEATGAVPDDPTADDLAAVAGRAVEAGADYLRERFRSGETDAEYTAVDVTTAADREAEGRVLEVIREAHPAHAVAAEESGTHPGEGYRWVVDALDGTNNFAAGIPTFGVAATVRSDGVDPETVATAVAVPMLGDLYVAARGGGVRYNGRPVTVDGGDDRSLSQATVGMVIGGPVIAGGDPAREWDRVTDAVEGVTKRAIQTWAPVVYWGLLARGRLDGFVCYYPDEREQVAGELLAREAGAHERADSPLSVFGRTPAVADGLWTAATSALETDGSE